jgi:hypothetical protein
VAVAVALTIPDLAIVLDQVVPAVEVVEQLLMQTVQVDLLILAVAVELRLVTLVAVTAWAVMVVLELLFFVTNPLHN